MNFIHHAFSGPFFTLVAGIAVGSVRLGWQAKAASTAIADLLLPEDILLNVEVSSTAELFDEVGRHMEREHALPKKWVALSLARRELVGSTGLGDGVAIPHARVKDLDRIQVAYLRLNSPIPFGAPDGKPVVDVLVLLVPKQATEEHLRILADATRLFSDRNFREQLHRCKTSLAVKEVFMAWSATPS